MHYQNYHGITSTILHIYMYMYIDLFQVVELLPSQSKSTLSILYLANSSRIGSLIMTMCRIVHLVRVGVNVYMVIQFCHGNLTSFQLFMISSNYGISPNPRVYMWCMCMFSSPDDNCREMFTHTCTCTYNTKMLYIWLYRNDLFIMGYWVFNVCVYASLY